MDRRRAIGLLIAIGLLASEFVPCVPLALPGPTRDPSQAEAIAEVPILVALCACHATVTASVVPQKLAVLAEEVELPPAEPQRGPFGERVLPGWFELALELEPPPPRLLS